MYDETGELTPWMFRAWHTKVNVMGVNLNHDAFHWTNAHKFLDVDPRKRMMGLGVAERDVHRICLGVRINGDTQVDKLNIQGNNPDSRVDKELLNVISFGEDAFGDDLEELRKKDITIPEYLRKLEFVLHGPVCPHRIHGCPLSNGTPVLEAGGPCRGGTRVMSSFVINLWKHVASRLWEKDTGPSQIIEYTDDGSSSIVPGVYAEIWNLKHFFAIRDDVPPMQDWLLVFIIPPNLTLVTPPRPS